jgi:CO/xanthine dehydrogenase Mo-binding subunit
MGIGMTLLEETVFDPETGRIANATFGDYLIPANADVADLDSISVPMRRSLVAKLIDPGR